MSSISILVYSAWCRIEHHCLASCMGARRQALIFFLKLLVYNEAVTHGAARCTRAGMNWVQSSFITNHGLLDYAPNVARYFNIVTGEANVKWSQRECNWEGEII